MSYDTLIAAMRGQTKGPKPDDATNIYVVRWHLASDQFDNYGARIGSSSTPVRLANHKIFVTKDKADALKRDIDAAFITLGYGIEGRCWIEEDWYE
jgi:hypothetical protein